MYRPIRKNHPLFKIIRGSLVDLPSPSNFSIWWNFGSLLGLCLTIQLVTGIFLAMHYVGHVDLAFSSVSHIVRDVNYGWLLRCIHANGASFFFVCLYFHVGRGLYYMSYFFVETWNIGVVIFILTMATAFVGYVLPWGQMSFWGATVITNLVSAIPYIGEILVQWIWGGFSVDNPTLTRFFSFHFFFPFVIAALSGVHLLFLHQTGSNNPLGLNRDYDKVPFHWHYRTKDLLGFFVIILLLFSIATLFPNGLTDPENFIPANPLVTPVHIQPEWYFLFAYAILRSIPNKLGGVIALFMSLLVLFFLPLTISLFKFRGLSFYPLNQILFWFFVRVFILLTWIGIRPVEDPYIFIGQVLTVLYFSYFVVNPVVAKLWEKMY